MAATRRSVDEDSHWEGLPIPARVQLPGLGRGAFVSNIGTWMQRTAQDWLVFTQLTHDDASAVGLVMALQFGPQLLLLPWTGSAADQLNQRKLLIVPLVTLFTRRRKIASQDTDAAGIVYAPRIASFTVETVELWFAERVHAGAAVADLQIVFASLSCTFLSPMRAGEILEISIALRRVGRSSLGFELVGHAEATSGQKGDRLCWMAETVCVCVDPATLRSRPIQTRLHDILHAVRRPQCKGLRPVA